VREVEVRDGLDGRVLADLLVAGVAHVEFDLRARVDLEHGLDRVVPDVVEGVRPDLVQ
jgi:hypothetical protein